MYLSIISGFLCISMVFAGVIDHLQMKYVVNDDGEMMEQDVGLSYENKYIQIDTAALDGKTSATIIHDTAESMTEYKQAGHCFVLSNGFEEVFSTDMDEWYEDKEGVQLMRGEDIVLYNYTAVPFCLDRAKIPSEMQEECVEIYPAVLTNILRGQDVYNSLENINTPYITKAYGPAIQNQGANRGTGRYRGNRQKRQLDVILNTFLSVITSLAPVATTVIGALGK